MPTGAYDLREEAGRILRKSFDAQKGFVLAAPEKLHALLEIVRLTVTREGVSVSELASSLGLSPAKVRDAVSLLSVIGVPPYRPDQLLDIFVDDDGMVYCDLDQGLAIEPRLSVEECEALALTSLGLSA